MLFWWFLLLSGTIAHEIHSINGNELKCDGVKSMTLGEMMDLKGSSDCTILKMREYERAKESNLARRLDVVQTCACNMINKSLMWLSMVNIEIEALFAATRKLVLEAGVETNKMEFMDRFVVFYKQQKMDPRSIGERLMQSFVGSYNRDGLLASQMELEKSKRVGEDEAGKLIDQACTDLVLDFGPFERYFKALDSVSKSSLFHYRAATLDENLTKLVVVYKMCKAMEDQSEKL